MTILSRVVWPGGELTVCGTPSKAWLDWLRTTTTPLTADQIRWRDCDFTDGPPRTPLPVTTTDTVRPRRHGGAVTTAQRTTRPATADVALLLLGFVAIAVVVHGSDFLTILIAGFCLKTLDTWSPR